MSGYDRAQKADLERILEHVLEKATTYIYELENGEAVSDPIDHGHEWDKALIEARTLLEKVKS